MGVLKVKVNGVWEEAGFPAAEPPMDEVWVGAGPPDPVGTYELWVDNTQVPPTFSFKHSTGNWVPLSSSEVEIGAVDPYTINTNSNAELWFDPTGGGKLFARIGGATGQWMTVAGDGNETEVEIGSGDPRAAGLTQTELWVDTSATPPVLKAWNNGAWVATGIQDVEPPLDEVWIGAGPPDPVATYEIWIDNTQVPPVAYFKHSSGNWVPLAGSEVEVGTVDPYTINPNSTAELWHDLTIGQAGKLKARVPPGPTGTWRPVAEFTESEVEIGPTDPTTVITPGTTELWVDTSTTPVVLKAWVNGGWQIVGGADIPAAPQEVEIGPAEPREVTVELWYDTTASPGTLNANNNGVWEPVGQPEVFVGGTDPYFTNPNTTEELWFNTASSVPGEVGTGAVLFARVVDEWVSIVPNEVHVSNMEPTNPEVELWYDVDATPTPVINAASFAQLTARIAALEAQIAGR